jgi:imidazolonepropionase-like amidohydrolase
MLRRFKGTLFFLSTLVWAACAPADGSDAVAVENVTVIAADGSAPLAGATVVIRGNRIDTVGVGVPVPEGARVVDGSGRYMIPGLFEMHGHTSKTRSSALGLYVANGVTTLRDPGGDHEELLRWRDEIRRGERLGPRMVIAGPYLESRNNVDRMRNTPPSEMVEPVERTRIPVGTPERARTVVDSLAGLELDFLKIRTVQDRATYLAIGEAADAHGLSLQGHAFGIPPELILEAGQDAVDHFLFPTLDSLSREERMAHWAAFSEAGVAVIPTLLPLWHGAFAPVDSIRAVVGDTLGEGDPRRRYVSHYTWLDWREQALEAGGAQEMFRPLWESTLRNTREMIDAGMWVLVGTDVAVIDIYPGFSLHDELALFVEELGLTPAEAIERATRQPAEFLGMADAVGTVAPGKLADLVLLDADPTADIANTTRIAGVFLRGEYYDRDALDGILEDVLAAPDQTVNDWPRMGNGVP